MKIKFVETEKPTNRAAIKAVADQLRVDLPEEYIEHLLQHNGGSPEPDTFTYRQVKGKAQRTMVAWFFSVGPHEDESLLEFAEDFEGRVPVDTLPIARDPGGSLILIGVAGTRRGQVLFWDRNHEAPEGDPPWEKNIVPLAPNLAAFLDMLGPE